MQRQRQLSPGRYETARVFVQKLRRAMVNPERQPLTGAVEVEECFVGAWTAPAGRPPARHEDARGRFRSSGTTFLPIMASRCAEQLQAGRVGPRARAC